MGWRLALVRDPGLIFDAMIGAGQYPAEHLRRELSFIHLGFTHSIFAVVLLLALGKLVAEAMGQSW